MGTATTQRNNTPKLRFSGFDDEWGEYKFSDLVKINQGLQIAISERLTTQVPESYFYITNEFLRPGNKKKYYIKNPPPSVLCNEDDVLMTRTGNTGMVVTGVEGAFHNNFFKIKYLSDELHRDFLVYFLKLPVTQNLILKLAGTSTIPDLNHSDFYRIKITKPTLTEQQKIADFLGSVDAWLDNLRRQRAALDAYKRGMLQKLFTQQVRFMDENGKDYPEWDLQPLKEIFQEVSRAVGDLNIETHSITAGKGFVSQAEKFGRDISGKQKNNYTLLEHGEFSYNKGNSKTYTYGCVYANHKNQKIAVPKVFISFKLTDKEFSTNFYEQLFISHYLDKYLAQIISSGARMDGLLNVNKTDFFKIKVPVPSSKEQQKIADFLTALDQTIAAKSEEIAKVERWKKGLMQKMFV